MIKSDPFALVQRATKKAFQRVGKVANVEPDPDFRLYSNLRPEHFQSLMKVYGEGPVIDYIREMESSKIMKKGGK
jgi:hypothetical protein